MFVEPYALIFNLLCKCYDATSLLYMTVKKTREKVDKRRRKRVRIGKDLLLIIGKCENNKICNIQKVDKKKRRREKCCFILFVV